MSHAIYTTRAFVISSSPVGESNALFSLYTENLGHIRARAQSVRAHTSKLRYSLQPFSKISVELVRGREIWRITNASHIEFPWLPLERPNAPFLALCGRIFKLVGRLTPGEDPNPELFRTFDECFNFLKSHATSLDHEKLILIEVASVLRILVSLGYLDRAFLGISLESPLSLEYLETLKPYRTLIVRTINDSIAAAQL